MSSLEFGNLFGEKVILTGCVIIAYNITMNERMQAIKALEKAGYFLKRHGANHDIYCNIELRCSIPLKRHSFDKNDLRYIQKEIEQGVKK